MAKVEDSLLGRGTRYDNPYSPELLFPIPRAESRAKLVADVSPDQALQALGFQGEDWWTCYEFSWLSPSGLPKVALAHFKIPASSTHIIESKSFKLYLNSFNQHEVADVTALEAVLTHDLSAAAGADVEVSIDELGANNVRQASFPITQPDASWCCIDGSEYDASQAFVYEPDSSLLKVGEGSEPVTESLYSELLRSNCPVTDQPDWGTVFIHYAGAKIDRESLLRYIVSFRQCQDFHEHCVERIFNDLKQLCGCESLSVYARYTRRGGLDINPYRATPDLPSEAPRIRTVRQ